jgi:sulfoacetaldehyde dehydrogenase
LNNTEISAKDYVAGLMERARKAQKIAETFSQEKVDELVGAMAWAIVKDENAKPLAKLAYEESQLGYYDAKYIKLQKKVRGAYRDMKYKKSVGVIERDEEKGIIKIAKPVGVVGAITPCTNPAATPVINAMGAIKGRNAIVFSPHPRSKKTCVMLCNILRNVLKKYGAPEDLIIAIENPTLEMSSEVMKQCDLIIATGGGALVKAAYGSGTPAYGVGAGNAVVIVDETADLDDACHKIMLSKTFDFATSCSSDNAIVVQSSVYNTVLEKLKKEGGYLLTPEEKAKLQKAMFLEDGHLNPKSGITAQAADVIANIAGFSVPEGTRFLMVEEEGQGAQHPFSGEKLSVVLTVYKYDKFEEAIDKVNAIHEWSGKGHSCGIHSTNEEHIEALYEKTYTSRVMVRQPVSYGNSGNWDNGMPFTLSLGCGTWGGNISSENITWKHMINVTWVSYPIKEVIPSDEELFGDLMKE